MSRSASDASMPLHQAVLSGVHEMKNQLMVILNSATMLGDGKCSPQCQQDISDIVDAVRRCDRTVDRLLAEARTAAGPKPARRVG